MIDTPFNALVVRVGDLNQTVAFDTFGARVCVSTGITVGHAFVTFLVVGIFVFFALAGAELGVRDVNGSYQASSLSVLCIGTLCVEFFSG
jgi:hypothetical protein